MKLISASVEGFRRFASRSTVRLAEPLIAVVGSNEAGKSSFLHALTTLNDDEAIPRRDQTRRGERDVEVTAAFELESTDYDRLSDIPGSDTIGRCTFKKARGGRVRVGLEPSPPHDLTPRKHGHTRWLEVADHLPITGKKEERQARQRKRDQITEALASTAEYLGEKIDRLDDAAEWIREVAEDEDALDEGAHTPLFETAELIEDLASLERSCPPELVRRRLRESRPEFLLFTDPDRKLRKTYDLPLDVDEEPAFVNLANLCGLDLDELHDAVSEEDVPRVSELIDTANATLENVFSRAWIRDEVVPLLDCQGATLHLMVYSPDREGRSWIDERSDGLRWFVALLAFLDSRSESARPVLLIDEAESHLSYDAQASLIDVLETQRLAKTVVYTTHSAGCLPSDLGTGIRPVVPGQGERSEIRNSFWVEGPGFSPLLLAMGLGPLAFTNVRNELVGEGPSECLLMPTLIRQAAEVPKLTFQIAPGASNIAHEYLPDLASESGRVAFLLDGDAAGKKRAKAIKRQDAVDDGRVKTYADFGGDGLILEELIDVEHYVEAVNRELRRWQTTDASFTVEDLSGGERISTVEAWCRSHGLQPIQKATVCQTLAEMAADGSTIFAAEHRELLIKVHDWAVQVLPPPSFAVAEGPA